MLLGVRLGVGLEVELQVGDSRYGLGLEMSLKSYKFRFGWTSCTVVLDKLYCCAGQAVLLCRTSCTVVSDKLYCCAGQAVLLCRTSCTVVSDKLYCCAGQAVLLCHGNYVAGHCSNQLSSSEACQYCEGMLWNFIHQPYISVLL